MKKKIWSFFIAVLAVTSVCSAQSERIKGEYYFHRSSHNNEVISVSYNVPSLRNVNGYTENLHGVSLDYTRLLSVSPYAPLFLETGIGFSTYFGKKFTTNFVGNWGNKEKMYFVAAKVPVNIGYKINFNNHDFIYPYMSLYLRSGLWGHYLVGEEEIDAFSKSTVGEENAMKYFQCGYGYGVKFAIGELSLGIGVEKDFNNCMLDTKMSVNRISVGYIF